MHPSGQMAYHLHVIGRDCTRHRADIRVPKFIIAQKIRTHKIALVFVQTHSYSPFRYGVGESSDSVVWLDGGALFVVLRNIDGLRNSTIIGGEQTKGNSST